MSNKIPIDIAMDYYRNTLKVSSDKLKELPDANAAEAIARLPGVSVQREGGEGNKVVIREKCRNFIRLRYF